MMKSNNNVKDMTIGSPFKLILSFSAPLIAGNIFQQLYTIVDTMVVGKKLGVTALAALGTIDTIYWVTNGVVLGITQGCGIVISQTFGKKDNEKLNYVIGNSISLSAIMSVILLTLIQILIVPALLFLKLDASIMPLSELYLRILIGGIPIVIAYNICAVILRSVGDSQSPLRAMIISTIMNVCLDILFVCVFEFGIAGAAIATLISQFFSAFYCVRKILSLDIISLKKDCFKPSGKLISQLIKLGTPLALQNVIISFGGMVLQSIIDGFGVLVIAASTATNKLYGILECAASAYGFAMTTYVGQNYGAGKIDRVRKGVTVANIISVISCIIIASITIGFGKIFLGLFISGTPEEEATTLRYAYIFLCTMSVTLPILYIIYIYRSVMQGLGHTVIPMITGFVELAIRLVAAWILPMKFGPESLFCAHVLAWVGSDILLIPGYYYCIKKASESVLAKK